jgi:hypothetical protein
VSRIELSIEVAETRGFRSTPYGSVDRHLAV